ncbi:MAG: GTP-binding protein, partial [Victivallales bacterium]|nr:GTP-binding protein [Victivallales bacterium]
MKNCPADKIRNFVLAGHAGAGKTTLADLLLFKSGAVGRKGSVDNGTSVSDFRAEEQERKNSIYTGILHCPWKDGHFFFADTPGNTDFCGEAMNAINMCDMMILVIDAMSGIGPGTIRAWNQARDRKMPRMIFINGCDRDQVNIEGTLENVVNSYGKTVCIPCTIPDGSAATFKGVHSVLAADAPAEAEDYKSALMDAIAESDEALMEKYLETMELSDEEIATGFKKAVIAGTLVPIFFGSANKDLGVAELADAILTFGPSPLEDIPMNIAEGELDRKSSNALGYVFKSVNDSFIGQMNYIRILSGTFKSDSELTNATKNSKERVGNLLQIQGKDQATIEEAGPGEFIAIAKLKNTGLNDVLATGDVSVKFGPVKYPQSTTFYAVSAVAKGEEDKLGAGLKRLQDEDPTIVIDRNPETKQTIVSCMGDQYMNLMVARLKKDFKVEVALDTPRIAYRETINGTGTA